MPFIKQSNICFLLLITIFSTKVIGQTVCKTTGSFSISSPSWSCSGSGLPRTYIVQAGHTLSINADWGNLTTSVADTLIVYGNINFSVNRGIYLSGSAVLLVRTGGSVTGGNGNSKIYFGSSSSVAINGSSGFNIIGPAGGSSATAPVTCVTPIIDSISSNNPICIGDTLRLRCHARGASLAYTWSGVGTLTSPNDSITNIISATSSRYYCYVYSAGCSVGENLNILATVNTSPIMVTCPINLNLIADSNCKSTGFYTVSALASPTPTFKYKFTGATVANGAGTGTGQQFNVGITNITVTAKNVCDSVVCNFSVTVTDTTKPVCKSSA